MNPDTGQIYQGEAEIAAALARGENLIPLADGIGQQLKQSEQSDRQMQRRRQLEERARNRRFVQRSLGARR